MRGFPLTVCQREVRPGRQSVLCLKYADGEAPQEKGSAQQQSKCSRKCGKLPAPSTMKRQGKDYKGKDAATN